MVKEFEDGARMGLIRGGVLATAQEINSSRRQWKTGYTGTRCYWDNDLWDLKTGGDSTRTPGTTDDWIVVSGKEVRPIPHWEAGNVHDRIEEQIGDEVWTLILREGGDRTIDPLAPEGPANWTIEVTAGFPLTTDILKYMTLGNVTYYAGKLYELTGEAILPPSGSTNAIWRDILDEAPPIAVPEFKILSVTGGYQ